MSLSAGEVTPVGIEDAAHLSKNSSANWLSKVRSSCSKSLRRSARATKRSSPYCRPTSDTRRLHASCSARRPTSHVDSGRHGNSSVAAAADAASVPHSAYLKGLVNKTWRIHRMSPMHKFSIKPSSLRVYSRHLSAHIDSVSSKKLAAVEETADLARIKPLKLTTADGSKTLSGIEIELLQRPKRGPAYVVLTAVLCSTESCSADVTLGGLDSEFTSLPLVLVRGPVMLRDALFTWWQSQFDCCISLIHMPPLELSWMVAMFAGFIPDSHAKNVELVYQTPDEVTGLSRIVYRIDPHDCQRLWLSIHSSDADSFHANEVVCFIDALEEHFYQHFKIKLAALQLSRVGTSIVYVSRDGGLKMYSVQHVLQVLLHLVYVVQEEMSSSE